MTNGTTPEGFHPPNRRRTNLRKIGDTGGSLRGYQDGYSAGHASAFPVIRIPEADLSFYAGAEPIPNDPATPEGRYRKDFRTGWLDGYQDGRAIISYMLKPPPGEP